MISVRRLVWLFCLGVGMNAWAGTVSLNPVANTTISQETPSPTNTELEVGSNGQTPPQNSRSLLKFDVAGSIPSNATITSATLTVYVYKVPPPAVTSTYDLRAALLSWDETNASWNNRQLSTPWSTPGGAVGVDFSSKITQTYFSDANLGLHTFVSNSNMVADLQNWLRNPGTNFGWVMISESEGTAYTVRKMYPRAGIIPPVLAVQFTLPAASPPLVILPLTNRVFRFSFNAESNRIYAAQYTGSLAGTNWNALTNFNASSVATNFLVNDPLTPSNRFYRIQTP